MMLLNDARLWDLMAEYDEQDRAAADSRRQDTPER
jgi:hypothetical protein